MHKMTLLGLDIHLRKGRLETGSLVHQVLHRCKSGKDY